MHKFLIGKKEVKIQLECT